MSLPLTSSKVSGGHSSTV